MFKNKVLFLSEKRYICQNQVISAKAMTQIFDPKNCNKYLKNKISRYYTNIWKSKKGGSVKADFLCGGVS